MTKNISSKQQQANQVPLFRLNNLCTVSANMANLDCSKAYIVTVKLLSSLIYFFSQGIARTPTTTRIFDKNVSFDGIEDVSVGGVLRALGELGPF